MDYARYGQIGSLQDGLISRDQCLEVLPHKRIERMLAVGLLEPVHAAVYRQVGAPHTWRQSARAATMIRSSPSPLLSHLSACALWGLIDWTPKAVEVLVPYGTSARVPGIIVHRTRKWHELMMTTHQGIPITTPARSIIDVTAVSGTKTVKTAVDTALTTQVLKLDDIGEELDRIGTAGRKRCSMLFEVLSRYSSFSERTKSHSEIDLMNLLGEHGLPLPIPQLPIRIGNERVVYPDFAYPLQQIAVEMQSWRWHGGAYKFEDDIERKNDLQRLGWTVIEFSAKTPEQTMLAVIRRALSNSNAA